MIKLSKNKGYGDEAKRLN